MKLLIAVALMLAVTACDVDVRVPNTPERKSYGATHIQVWHDDQRGVTCWLYGSTNGGISCLPDGVLQQ